MALFATAYDACHRNVIIVHGGYSEFSRGKVR